jgi:large subunit ribosomal protein L13
MVSMQTRFARKEDYKDNRRWYHVDAAGKVLGRLAARVAMALMGKDRPEYTPNVDTGAFVVVTNAEKVAVSGTKARTKTYARFSGYPGGYKEVTFEEMMRKHPDRVIREAVRRMLPKNALGDQMLKKLKVYAGPRHPHTYHKPEPLEV